MRIFNAADLSDIAGSKIYPLPLPSLIRPHPHIYGKEIPCIGVSILKVKAGQDIEERAVILGRYILEHKATVRAAAKQFGISKSTVHKDITEKLPVVCPQMYPAVKEILEINKQERHIRGGMATKHKYEEKSRESD